MTVLAVLALVVLGVTLIRLAYWALSGESDMGELGVFVVFGASCALATTAFLLAAALT